MVSHHELFIGGRWVASAGDGWIAVRRAADGRELARVPDGVALDVERAVSAACGAAHGWARTPVAARADHLEAIARGLDARRRQLAETISAEVGTPIRDSDRLQVEPAVRTFARAAEIVRDLPMRSRAGASTVERVPVGVVGAITPWNYPLYLLATKVAPALAAGCPVVVKPSEVAPLSALVLAEVAAETSLPAGVLNVLSGRGATAGAALAAHPELDLLSFTGSDAVGIRVAALAGRACTRVTLELGGKSPSVVLDDAPLQRAVEATVAKCFQNAGQTCAALTRLLVPVEQRSAAEELARAAAERSRIGDPADRETTMGPLVSEQQRERVVGMISSAVAEGARVVCGGIEPPFARTVGAYVRPTVLSDVRPEMAVAAEEVFGPVLAIMSHRSVEEAIDLANGTGFGLSAAVWSRDEHRARAVAGALRAGSVSINGAPTDPDLPFGGFGRSGFGRERGAAGIEEMLTTKVIHR